MEKTFIFLIIVAGLFAVNMRAEQCGIQTQKSIHDSYVNGELSQDNLHCIVGKQDKIFVAR